MIALQAIMDAGQTSRKRREAFFYMLSISAWLLISSHAMFSLIRKPHLVDDPDAYSHWVARASLWMQTIIGPIIILLMAMTRRNLRKKKSSQQG